MVVSLKQTNWRGPWEASRSTGSETRDILLATDIPPY